MASDLSQDTGFLGFFHKLPAKSETTVRFFNRTDFYTVHGSDATFVAKEVFKSTNNVKTIGSGDKKTESLVLNRNQFERLVRDLLLVQQYRVEVYVGRGNEWSLEYKGSPGNLAQFEDLIFGLDVVAGGVVMAVKASGDARRRTLGVGVVSLEDSSLTVCQLEEDEGYTGLEGLLVQLAPKEVVLPESGDYQLIAKVVKRCGPMVVLRKTSSFSTDSLTGDLNRLLAWKSGQAENCLALPELQMQVACAALNAAIGYLELANDESNLQQFSLSALTPAQYVHVDASAARALGLVAGPGSLLSHLDRCRTAAGKRLLAQWLKQPLRDAKRISDRLSLVEALVADCELRSTLSDDLLRRFPDLQLLARRLQRKASSMQDCYKVYLAIERVGPVLEALQAAAQCPVVREQLVAPLEEHVADMGKFQEMVTSTLDMEAAERGEFLVQSSFSEELGELRERMDTLTATANKELKSCAQDLGLEVGKGIKLETNQQLGFVFRTTNKKEERTIRSRRDLKLIDGNKTGVRFQSSRLEGAGNEYMSVQREYDHCQKSIVQEIVNIAAGYAGSILGVSQVLARLDVVTSFAVVSANAPTPYTRPTLLPSSSDGGRLRLLQARHPVMEALDSVAFIPNDVQLDHAHTTFHVITGPNMGGKSTWLRTVGACAVLAHVGCFVPCAEAELSVLDAILARVGAGDCQLAGVSTFMNEMVETSAILKRATSNSLVLIDELGRGTSTYEGCGLAWSIARELAVDTRAFSLFATHFQELTLLENETPLAANWHVSAVTTEHGLTLLYALRSGPCDRSFGIEVARMAKLPPAVIQAATEKLRDLEQRQGLGMSGVNLTPDEVAQGELLVDQFLRAIKEGGVEKLPALRSELLARGDHYVQVLLS